MSKNFYIFFFLLLTITMTSCYNYRSIGLLQEKNASLPKYKESEYVDYRIRVNDEIIYRLMTSDVTISKLIS